MLTRVTAKWGFSIFFVAFKLVVGFPRVSLTRDGQVIVDPPRNIDTDVTQFFGQHSWGVLPQ